VSHYRDLEGSDLGVPNTPENREAMRRAAEWLDGQIYRGVGLTYVWEEAGKLYFGGAWLGAWDFVNHTYMPRGLSDPRTSWQSRGDIWRTREALDRLIDRILEGGQS
jgi:hypothetical protein